MILNDYVPEGVEAMVPYKGSVVEIIRQVCRRDKVRAKLLRGKNHL